MSSFKIYSRVDDANATTVQSIPVSSENPTTGALMQYDGVSWAPGPVCGTGYFNPLNAETSVVCNGVAGKVTMEAKASGSAPSMPFVFTVTNSYVKSTDIILANVQYPITKKGTPLQISINNIVNGSFSLVLIGTWPAPGFSNITVFFQILRPQ